MDQKREITSLLPKIRVLDLTDEKGFLCGKILGDLGADVIKIEKPGGDPSRRIGAFYHDIPDPEKSLYWFAYNNNKRGITLSIETRRGQDIYKELIRNADIIIESFPPGYMDQLGLGYSMCSEMNPRLIMISITPFGQTGPYRDYKGCDIVCMAMSGFMYICGDGDKPPVRAIAPQAYLNAAADGAARPRGRARELTVVPRAGGRDSGGGQPPALRRPRGTGRREATYRGRGMLNTCKRIRLTNRGIVIRCQIDTRAGLYVPSQL